MAKSLQALFALIFLAIAILAHSQMASAAQICDSTPVKRIALSNGEGDSHKCWGTIGNYATAAECFAAADPAKGPAYWLNSSSSYGLNGKFACVQVFLNVGSASTSTQEAMNCWGNLSRIQGETNNYQFLNLSNPSHMDVPGIGAQGPVVIKDVLRGSMESAVQTCRNDSTAPIISNISISPQFPAIFDGTANFVEIINNGSSQNIGISFTSNEYPINITFNIVTEQGILKNSQNFRLTEANFPISYTIPSLGEGIYILNMQITDDAGNSRTIIIARIVRQSASATAPQITSFHADPTTFSNGVPSTVIHWSSINTVSCAASGSNQTDWNGQITTIGTKTVHPISQTEYTLQCSNAAGQTTSLTITVIPGAAPPAFTITGIVTTPGLPLTNTGSQQTISINFTSSKYPINVQVSLESTSGSTIRTLLQTDLSSATSLPLNVIIPSSLSVGSYKLAITAKDLQNSTIHLVLGDINVQHQSSSGGGTNSGSSPTTVRRQQAINDNNQPPAQPERKIIGSYADEEYTPTQSQTSKQSNTIPLLIMLLSTLILVTLLGILALMSRRR